MTTETDMWLSMSLAEGMTRRDLRLLREKLHTPASVYNAVMMNKFTAAAKRTRFIEEELRNFRGYWCKVPSRTDKHTAHYRMLVVTAKDELDLYQMRVSKKDVSLVGPITGASFHAMARTLYRNNFRTLLEVADELFADASNSLLMANAAKLSKSDVISPTVNGFAIVQMFDDGVPRAVTWVHNQRAAMEVAGVAADPYSVYKLLKKKGSGSIYASFISKVMSDPKLNKLLIGSYVAANGLTLDDKFDLDHFEDYAYRTLIESGLKFSSISKFK